MITEEKFCPVCKTIMQKGKGNGHIYECPKCQELILEWVCVACDSKHFLSTKEVKGLGDGVGIEGERAICPNCGAKKLMAVFYLEFLEQTKNQPTPQLNTSVCCPYCHSNKTSKIGAVGRLISVGILGLAGSKIGKQWHCKNCGSNF